MPPSRPRGPASSGRLARSSRQQPFQLGVFIEGWRPEETPVRWHTPEAFIDAVAGALPPEFPADAGIVARRVLKVLWSEMNGGAMEKIKGEVPEAIRTLWPKEPIPS